MEITPYFEKIEEVLIKDLAAANNEILLAVAWFTNKRIFDVLIDKLNSNKDISIKLVVINDNINNRIGGLDFQQFINAGGVFYFAEKNIPMHNKYCIIDSHIVVTGSYNYTYYAESTNEENIIRFKGGGDVALSYIDNFGKLISNKKPIEDIKKYLEIFPPMDDMFSYSNYAYKDIIQQVNYYEKQGNKEEAKKLKDRISTTSKDVEIKDYIITKVIYEQWKPDYYIDRIDFQSNIITVRFRTILSNGCMISSPGTRNAWILRSSNKNMVKTDCCKIKNIRINEKLVVRQARYGYIYNLYVGTKPSDFSDNVLRYRVNENKQMIDSNGKVLPVSQIKISENDVLTCDVCFETNNPKLINGTVDFIEGLGNHRRAIFWNAFKIMMNLNREYQ